MMNALITTEKGFWHVCSCNQLQLLTVSPFNDDA